MIDRLVAGLRPLQFKGKARLLNPLVPRAGIRSAVVHGFRMDLDLAEHNQRMAYLGAYERWETRVVRRYLRVGMCMVDVGANIGYFALLAAKCVGKTGRVFAIEPSVYMADKLSLTLQRNKVENVRLDRCGAGAGPGVAILYDPQPDLYTPSMFGAPMQTGREVPIRPLDDLAREWEVSQIDLLKVDVEGYELAVFQGARELFKHQRIKSILCEFNAHWLARAGTTSVALYRHLIDLGFRERTGPPVDPASAFLNRFLVHSTVC